MSRRAVRKLFIPGERRDRWSVLWRGRVIPVGNSQTARRIAFDYEDFEIGMFAFYRRQDVIVDQIVRCLNA